MRCRFALFGGLSLFASSTVAAQQFNQAIVFGDSTVDSGWYKNATTGSGLYNSAIADAVKLGGQAKPGGPGLMVSEALADYFGLTATPANQPGGTNFAVSGARSNLANPPGSGLFPGAVPATTQINNYLALNGGQADRNGLYLISAGANDVAFAINQMRSTAQFPIFPLGSAAADTYIVNQAQALAGGIVQLSGAGARYIIVPNLIFSFPTSAAAKAAREDRFLYSQTLWSKLAAADVNFIPADVDAVRRSIQSDAGAFGLTSLLPGTPGGKTSACQINAASLIDTAWGLVCIPTVTPPVGDIATLVSPTATGTSLFADNEHFAAAGQKILADYYYSLVVAPSQISFLPETAVKTRTRLVSNIQTQIDASAQQPPGPSGLNVWVTGDTSHLRMDNYPGFPDDPSTPVSIAAGISKRLTGGLIVGAAISAGHLESDFSGNRGDFSQDEFTGSVYAAYLGSPLWGMVVGTYGALDYDVNRHVPIGITLQRNSAETDGHNISVAAQGGIDVKSGPLTHGPVVGITWQRVSVDGFTEEGGFTSLAFGDQTRDSAITALGYRVSLDLGLFRPFAQATWNHELASTDRDVTASLTTIAAPSYHMPAVVLGKDWGTAIVGTNIRLAPGVSALAAFSTEFGQDDAVTYGGQIGLNIAF
jgi:outer membrane lipase/esterase